MESVFKIQKGTTRANTIQFQVSPTHVAYVNTLRRLCMSHVELVGFRADIQDNGTTSDVVVKINSTPMTNEMLAHRIGLLPVYVKEPLKWNPEKYKFILHVVNDTDEVKDVFAGDFKVFEKNGVDDQLKQVPSSQFFPPHPVTGKTALLATLKPMMPGGSPEEILLEAVATVGIGRENARFIPTSQCSYGYTKDVNPETLKKVFDDWLIQSKMELNPSALETQPEKKAILEREFKTLEINRCYLKNEKGEPYSFDFTVESVDVLDPAYIVLRGCEAGIELCEKFRSDSLPESVVVQRIEGLLHGFDFFFQGQDHTLGHLIQAWIDENIMDDSDITFVGYDIPHPLRDEMVIRIGVSETVDNDEATARNALQKAMTACQAMFQRWRNEWYQLTVSSMASQSSTAIQADSTVVKKRPILRRPTTAVTTATTGL